MTEEQEPYTDNTLRRFLQAKPLLNGKVAVMVVTAVVAIISLWGGLIMWNLSAINDSVVHNQKSIESLMVDNAISKQRLNQLEK